MQTPLTEGKFLACAAAVVMSIAAGQVAGAPEPVIGTAGSSTTSSYLALPSVGTAGVGATPLDPMPDGSLMMLDEMDGGRTSGARASGQGRDWFTSIGVEGVLTLTDNVRLDPANSAQSDVIAEIGVPIALRRWGSRARLDLDYAPKAYAYVRTSEDNDIQHYLRSLLTTEVVDNFFHVEAAATVDQTYVSPLGPRPESGASATNNRTQQTVLRLSPYIARKARNSWEYLARNDTYWTTYDDSRLDDSLVNRVSLGLRSPAARTRTEFDYTYLYTKYESQSSGVYQQVGRVRPSLALTRRLKVGARVGYESNDYTLSSYSGEVYGAEVAWRPTPRTSLNGFIEHRFFGESYGLDFSHRSRRTLWRLSGTRDTYTSTDQTLTLRPGTTSQVLDEAFRSKIADPNERARAVQQFLSAAGLPTDLAQSYTFYANQIYLAEQWSGSVALLGRRNTIELTLFWQDNEPISADGSSLPLVIGNTDRLRQRGGRAVVTHRLTPYTNLSLTASRLYSTSTLVNGGASSDTTEDTLRLALSRQLAPRTNGSIGLRWVDSDSGTNGYKEQAVFAGVVHTF
jgi:uncharacterized protein (PEP-CTERM system associated)